MTKPQWLAAETARLGQLVLDGASTRADAVGIFAAKIRKRPEFVADLIATTAEKELTKWLAANAAEVTTSQLLLFPEMPLRMRVAPTRNVPVAAMDRHQLEAARRMLWARTQNQMDGARESAERERAVFASFYDKVHPLMSGDMTVADALERLARAA